jgi:hypothetical protein
VTQEPQPKPLPQAQPTSPDPELLARWIAIGQLLASADELRSRHAGAWPGLALVTADTANEAVLGLIAASGSNPPEERDSFDQVYSAALSALRERELDIPQSMRTRIQQSHRARNSAVHLGVDPVARLADTAIRTAPELRALAVEALDVLRPFHGSGPVGAVAELVGLQSVSEPLREAERLLAEGSLADAADQTSIALDA